jgi:hypothetical protein
MSSQTTKFTSKHASARNRHIDSWSDPNFIQYLYFDKHLERMPIPTGGALFVRSCILFFLIPFVHHLDSFLFLTVVSLIFNLIKFLNFHISSFGK